MLLKDRPISSTQGRGLLAAVLLMFAYGIANTTLGYFVTPVTESLNLSRASFTLHYSIMSVTSALMAPITGRLIQRAGVGKVIYLGCVCCGSMIAAFSFCQNLWMFYGFAVLMGLLQYAATSISAVVIINKCFPGKNGTPIGIAMAGSGISGVVMGMVLPGLISAMGWRVGYRFLAICWVILLLCAAALSRGSAANAETPPAMEDRAPLTQETVQNGQPQAYRNPKFYLFLLIILLLCAGTCFLQHMPAHLVEMGVSDTFAGRIMSLFSMFLLISKISEGSIFDRLGSVKTVILIFSVYALGFWCLLIQNSVILSITSALVAFGMASMTVLPPLLTPILFGRDHFTAVYSVVTSVVTLGGAIGSPAWGLLHDTVGTYKPGIVVFPALLLIAALVLSFLLKSSKYRE